MGQLREIERALRREAHANPARFWILVGAALAALCGALAVAVALPLTTSGSGSSGSASSHADAAAPGLVAQAGQPPAELVQQISAWAQPREGHPPWDSAHAALVASLEQARGSGALRGGLLWFGDSITESLVGLAMGQPGVPRTAGIDRVFEELWASRVSTAVLAISGDETAHLAWRLLNGESPAGLGARVATVLIGVNDIGIKGAAHHSESLESAADLVSAEVAGNAIQIAQLLLAQDAALQLVLQGVLPVGTNEQLFLSKDAYLSRINAALRKFAGSEEAGGRCTFVYCGDVLLAQGGGKVDERYMPDGLHPNAEGWRRLSGCLQPALLPLLEEREKEAP